MDEGDDFRLDGNSLLSQSSCLHQGKIYCRESVLFCDFVSLALHKVDAIYLNFAKAFDKVEHAILIAKLRKLDFGGNLLKLIESYPQDRIQVVNIKGYRSRAVNASSKVLHGSILRPILLSCVINDLFLVIRYCQALGCKAYDCKLFHIMANIEDATNLQLDFQKMQSTVIQ